MPAPLTRRQFLAVAGLFAVVALGIYGRSLGNEFVSWDDDLLVYENPLVMELSPPTVAGAFTSYDPELYAPLTVLSFQLEHALVGFQPFLFHLTNLLLHVGCCLLVLLLLLRLGLSRMAALLGALLFLVHPMNVEGVAWVSARKDLLCAFCFLASVLAYLRWREGRAWMWMGWALLLFLLALLSKVTAIMLPAIIVLIEWKQGGWEAVRAKGKVMLPFVILAIMFLVIGIVGKTRNVSEVTLLETMLLAGKSTVFHLWSYLAPFSLSLLYQQHTPITIMSPEFFLPLVFVGFCAGLILFLLRRTPTVARAMVFAALWYFLLLLPSFANFSKAGTIYYASDRYMYLAQLGIIFFAGLGMDGVWAMWRKHSSWVRVAAVIPVAVLLGCAVLSFQRSQVWANSETLFLDTLVANPLSADMHYNLGAEYVRKGEGEKAERALRESSRLRPNFGKPHNALGTLLRERGDIAGAESEYRAAMTDFSSPSQRAQAMNNIGSIYIDTGKIDDAIAILEEAVALEPNFIRAHNNLGTAYGKKGMYREGMEAFLNAMESQSGREAEVEELRRQLEEMEE